MDFCGLNNTTGYCPLMKNPQRIFLVLGSSMLGRKRALSQLKVKQNLVLEIGNLNVKLRMLQSKMTVPKASFQYFPRISTREGTYKCFSWCSFFRSWAPENKSNTSCFGNLKLTRVLTYRCNTMGIGTNHWRCHDIRCWNQRPEADEGGTAVHIGIHRGTSSAHSRI